MNSCANLVPLLFLIAHNFRYYIPQSVLSAILFLVYKYSILAIRYLYCAVQTRLLKPQNVNSLPGKTKLSKNETFNTSRAVHIAISKNLTPVTRYESKAMPTTPDVLI